MLEQDLDCAEVAIACRDHQCGPELVAVRLIANGSPLVEELKYFGVAERCRAVQRSFVAFIERIDGNTVVQSLRTSSGSSRSAQSCNCPLGIATGICANAA